MKVLHIDANNGIAGDMLLASLIQLSNNVDKTINELNHLGITNIEYKLEELIIDDKNVFNVYMIDNGNDFDCHQLKNIGKIVNGLNVDVKTKEDILNIYNLIGKAECIVHNNSLEDVHFHELGRIETFCNIVGIAYLINKLEIDKTTCSNIHVGKGTIKCSHGILDVPTPATKILLKYLPYYSKDIEGELCTPTGAALINYYVDEFNDLPTTNIKMIGWGMGKKKYSNQNYLKTIIYEI